MKSVIQSLNSKDFKRIRIGIGKPEFNLDLINYVIGKLSKEEYSKLAKGIDMGVEALEILLEKGIDNAMNIINAKN